MPELIMMAMLMVTKVTMMTASISCASLHVKHFIYIVPTNSVS